MYRLGAFRQENVKEDVCGLIRLFYDTLGGPERYSKLPDVVKKHLLRIKEESDSEKIQKHSPT